MTNVPFAVTALIFSTIATAVTASAAEINVLCAGSLKLAMTELLPDFQKSSGNAVTMFSAMGAPTPNYCAACGKTTSAAPSRNASMSSQNMSASDQPAGGRNEHEEVLLQGGERHHAAHGQRGHVHEEAEVPHVLAGSHAVYGSATP